MTEEEAPPISFEMHGWFYSQVLFLWNSNEMSLKYCSGSPKYALFISLFNPVMQMDNHSCPHACFFIHTHNHVKPCKRTHSGSIRQCHLILA